MIAPPGMELLAADHPVQHLLTDRRRYLSGASTLTQGRGDVEADRGGRVSVISTSGLWNLALGHGRPELDTAVREQLDRLAYGTLFRGQSEPAERLAQRLVELGPAGMSRVMFCTGGASGVELAAMMAHRVAAEQGHTRDLVLVLADGYHGTLLGSAALTGEDLQQHWDGIGRSHVIPLPTPGDAADAEDEVDRQTVLEETVAVLGHRIAAAIVEPVLGSAGVIELPVRWCQRLRALADEYGFLVVADEVATGVGRTGALWAAPPRGLAPDLLVTSKALSGGYLPLGAVLISARVAQVLDASRAAFQHGETQAGNPLACAAALAALDVVTREDLPERAARLGTRARSLIEERRPSVLRRCTGSGLMLGLHLRGAHGARRPSPELVSALVSRCADEGVRVHPSPRGISLMPPLTIDSERWDRCVGTVLDVLHRVPYAGPTGDAVVDGEAGR